MLVIRRTLLVVALSSEQTVSQSTFCTTSDTLLDGVSLIMESSSAVSNHEHIDVRIHNRVPSCKPGEAFLRKEKPKVAEPLGEMTLDILSLLRLVT